MPKPSSQPPPSPTHSFRVWAPQAETVTVEVATQTHSMHSGPGGWWSTPEIPVSLDSDYGFHLDAGPLLPDPRSPWQPYGISGLSRVYDHAQFTWTDQAWEGLPLASKIIYELHIGTFSKLGTFDSAIPHLDHIKSLGVNLVELMPVAEFSGQRGWGYDAVNLYAPHHAYGGPDACKRFVAACHARGLAVLMDVEYNHLGHGSTLFANYGPYFSANQTTWGAALNFDGPESGEVRRLILDNAEMWLRDYHCDGLRLDAIHAIRDDSPYSIVEEIADHCRSLSAQLGRPLLVIAESDRNDPRLIQPAQQGGYALDAVYADEFHHAIHTVLTEEHSGYYADFGGFALLAKAIRQAWVYTGQYSKARRRIQGRESKEPLPNSFLVFLQNHDQIGNRATGDRIGAALTPGRLKIGAALYLLSAFTPMIFQGEEWAASTPFQFFCDYPEPDLQAAVRTGRLQEFVAFGWDPALVPDPLALNTFQSSKLDWDELSDPAHHAIHTWYTTLVQLRRYLPALAQVPSPLLTTAHNSTTGFFSVQLGEVLLKINLGPLALEVQIPETSQLLAASSPRIRQLPGSIYLVPDSVAILRVAGVS